MPAEKVTFTLPDDLVRRLAEIPAGERSRFVKEAVARELKRQSALAALRRYRGKAIWKDRYHPDLSTSEKVARYRAAKSRFRS